MEWIDGLKVGWVLLDDEGGNRESGSVGGVGSVGVWKGEHATSLACTLPLLRHARTMGLQARSVHGTRHKRLDSVQHRAQRHAQAMLA